jgi:hypothetical protein
LDGIAIRVGGNDQGYGDCRKCHDYVKVSQLKQRMQGNVCHTICFGKGRSQGHSQLNPNSIKCARGNTLDGKIGIWHICFEEEMPNYKTFENQKKKPGLHFCNLSCMRKIWIPS